jgi:hypothetical protein
MAERVLLDSWTVETASGTRTTEIYTDAAFTPIAIASGWRSSLIINHDARHSAESSLAPMPAQGAAARIPL